MTQRQRSDMTLLTFKDTCGKRIDGPFMANIINFVSEKIGADPAFIMTMSQLNQAMAHLHSITPRKDREALACVLRDLQEQTLKACVSSLNPFAARAVEGLAADVRAGRKPNAHRLEHISDLAGLSYWREFQATKTLPDTCGQKLDPIMTPTVRVVCEALSIPESSIRTHSQLTHAIGLLGHTCEDEESEAELKQKLKAARIAGLEDVKPLVTGLGLEALNTLSEVAKGNVTLETDRVQRLLNGVRRSMLQDLKRKYPDLEQQIAESGDEGTQKLLAQLQSY